MNTFKTFHVQQICFQVYSKAYGLYVVSIPACFIWVFRQLLEGGGRGLQYLPGGSLSNPGWCERSRKWSHWQ